MTDNPSEEQNENQPKNKYGVNRRAVLKRAGVVTSALALGGTSAQPAAANPNTKTIKCGQRKIGYFESGEPDEYHITVSKETRVTATLEPHGPGYDKGKGNKGGQGNGKGQDTGNAPCLELIDSNISNGAGTCSTSSDPKFLPISLSLCLTPGTHLLTASNSSAPTKYQLSVDCEEC